MDRDQTDTARTEAIEQLERFGLSTYAARTFVALTRLGAATARDVSQASEMPRTRVYDAIDELTEWGLVDVQQSSPKQFWSISAETATRTFERDLQQRTDALRVALAELDDGAGQAEQRGVWTVEGRSTVTGRVLEFFGDAEEEIVYMTVEDLLTAEVIDGLRDAAERGVSINLAGISPDVEDRMREAVPEANTFESLWMWSDTPAGRLMMVDERATLVSVLVENGQAPPPRKETAIWGEGESNSLVVVLQAMFAWQLGAAESE